MDPAQVVVDDLGWHNVGWHNPDMITPNADDLVANGMTCAAALRSRPIGCQSEPALLAARRLDRSYQFWYCAPTRSSIMTGRLPYHVKCDLLSELTEAGSRIPLLCLQRGI